jgi:hypothetical protein
VETELELKLGQQQQKQQFSPIPPIKFKIAFEEVYNKHEALTCGIEKIDSLLQLALADRLAVIGNRRYTQTLITRLCVNALLSSKKKNEQERSRFFYTSNVILVDAGNSTDFYQHVNFARQYYRRDVIDRVLNSIIISRVFTIYQLANTFINELPKVIQKYETKMIVISDLLDMFLHDPQIELNEAKYLINEIVDSITKSRALEDVLVIVSLSYVGSAYHHNDKPAALYNKIILPRFDKCIKIMNNPENRNNIVDIKIRNNSVRRNKNTSNDFHNHKVSCSIKERDLLIIH